MRFLIGIALIAAGCSKDPGAQARPDTTGTGPGGACITDADCPPEQWCLHQRCSDRTTPTDPPGNDAHLTATPTTLNFGTVGVGQRHTLALVVENDGAGVVTIRDVTIDAAAPFAVESMGYGPFWIRPDRAREIFVTYAPIAAGSHSATLTIHSAAPPVEINLVGN